MSADGRGGVGIAFVGANNMLTFAYNDGFSGWAYDIGIAQAGYSHDVGLAFDARNNPVICYTDILDGSLNLAYDPATVPEPATIVLLGFGGLTVLRKRKR